MNRMDDPVTRQSFERRLEEVLTEAKGPIEGVFGPDSVTWRVDREAALFLGAGRALLLQLSHPWVAAAITEHSRALADPIGRFHRTFGIVFALVFGSLDEALAAARRLHQRHGEIEGTLPYAVGALPAGSPYRANDVAALKWVHATLVETSLLAHDLVLTPLGAQDRDRFYAESRILGGLFGIPSDELPATWSEFSAYCDAMRRSEILTVTAAARAIGNSALAGAGSWLRSPAWYRALTAGLLPPRLRDGFAIAYGEGERRLAERALRRLRPAYRRLPGFLRHVGPYHEARARLSGRSGPDLLTRSLNRLWIGKPALSD